MTALCGVVVVTFNGLDFRSEKGFAASQPLKVSCLLTDYARGLFKRHATLVATETALNASCKGA